MNSNVEKNPNKQKRQRKYTTWLHTDPVGVIQVSGRPGSPICVKTMTLTPCFEPKYPL